MKQTTLCYLVRDGKVLLAMKKRGFGVGKMNGPGGKLMDGESPEQACRREFQEETGCRLLSVEPRGLIHFAFIQKPEWDTLCHIFVATESEGEPEETEEMRPEWHDISSLPLDLMWSDDPLWLPDVLVGGSVYKKFYFDADGIVTGSEDLTVNI